MIRLRPPLDSRCSAHGWTRIQNHQGCSETHTHLENLDVPNAGEIAAFRTTQATHLSTLHGSPVAPGLAERGCVWVGKKTT